MNLLFIAGDKVVNSFLVIGLTALDQMIENYQDTMTDSQRGFLAPASRTDAAIVFAKIGLGMPRRMSCLNEDRLGPAIALTRAATVLFASRFLLARTNANSRSRMGCVWEVAHGRAQFAKHHLDASSREPGHSIDAFNEGIKLA